LIGAPELRALVYGSLAQYQRAYGRFERPLSLMVGLPLQMMIGGEAKDRLADLSALRDVPILAGTWKVRRAKLAGQLGVD